MVFLTIWTFLKAIVYHSIFDNIAPRLSKSTHFALQRLSAGLFWTTFFPKSGANHTVKSIILANSVIKSLWQKSIILKNRQVSSSKFEERKCNFWSKFDKKLSSSRKGPFGTLAKCFVLYHFGDESGFYALLTLFFTFSIFFYFFLFLCRRQKSVPRLRKTYNC